MGSVKNKLIEFQEAVINHFNLSDDVLEQVGEIIMENSLLTPDTSSGDVVKFFEKNIVCPQCLSLDGPACHCIQQERL
jgi:hypothetical protein